MADAYALSTIRGHRFFGADGIILDLKETTSGQLLGMAAVTLALGLTYWLIRERDSRLLQTQSQDTTSSNAEP